jgi:PKD repeat protein
VAVSFDGSSSSDVDGDALQYAWDFGDGATGAGATPTHTYASLGDFNVTLVVNDGALDSLPVTAAVHIVNRPPLASAGPDLTAELGSLATLVGAGSDPDDDALTYLWSEGATVLGNAPTLNVGLPLGGHTLTLTVTDAHGAAATDDVVLTVVDTTPPVVALVVPPGGFHLLLDKPFSFAWTAGDNGALFGFSLLVSTDGGGFTPAEGCAALPGTATGCTWTSPGPITEAGVVRLLAQDAAGNPAFVEAPFSVQAPALTLTSPLPGANWGLGSTQAVTFTHNLGASATFRIELSRNGGADFETLAPALPSPDGVDGALAWTVTGPPTSSALMRVVWNEGEEVSAVTVEPFVIAPASITVLAPNGGETWNVGTDETIAFTHNLGSSAVFRIELSRNGGVTWAVLSGAVGSVDATSGALSWRVTGPGVTRARVRVSSAASASVNDRSDANFTIR